MTPPSFPLWCGGRGRTVLTVTCGESGQALLDINDIKEKYSFLQIFQNCGVKFSVLTLFKNLLLSLMKLETFIY